MLAALATVVAGAALGALAELGGASPRGGVVGVVDGGGAAAGGSFGLQARPHAPSATVRRRGSALARAGIFIAVVIRPEAREGHFRWSFAAGGRQG
ncbi:MAG: hypothetical protein NVS3B10_14050 [Polyangiales bacterium]